MTISHDPDPQHQSVLRQIADLQRLPMPELHARWRVLMGAEPPPYNRQFLLKRLIYRVQELAYGGLPLPAHQTLERGLADAGYDALGAAIVATRKTALPRQKAGIPVVGTRLVREWNGCPYEVVVTRDGFNYDGRPYKSLTAVTKAITGTKWNGPHFFGLRQPSGKEDA
jgi:hypothetical protein